MIDIKLDILFESSSRMENIFEGFLIKFYFL